MSFVLLDVYIKFLKKSEIFFLFFRFSKLNYWMVTPVWGFGPKWHGTQLCHPLRQTFLFEKKEEDSKCRNKQGNELNAKRYNKRTINFTWQCIFFTTNKYTKWKHIANICIFYRWDSKLSMLRGLLLIRSKW